MGDLGNVTADKDGKASVSIEDAMISLVGDHSIIGRTMVVSVRVMRIHIEFLLSHSRVSFHGDFSGVLRIHITAPVAQSRSSRYFVG